MMTLLIMAAGNGSRYGALKQFDEMGPNNEFLFEFSIFDAINSGFNHIVIVTKEQFVIKINEYLSKKIPKNVKLDVIAQKIEDTPLSKTKIIKREKPWGTAHAVWTARNCIFNDFIVINADDYYGKDAFQKAAKFIKNNEAKNKYGLVPYYLKDTLSENGSVSRGVCNIEEDVLVGIKELLKIEKEGDTIFDSDSNTKLSGKEPVSMNFWIFNTSIFDKIEKQFKNFLKKDENIKNGEIFIPFIIQKLIDSKDVTVKPTKPTSTWFGVTYADDKDNAIQLLKNMSDNNEYPTPLWKN